MLNLGQLRQYCGFGANETAHDTILTELEAAAVPWLGRQTGRYWGEPVDTTEVLSGDGASYELVLANPASAITSVETRGYGSSAAWTTMATTAYEWDSALVIDGTSSATADTMAGAYLYSRNTPWPGGLRNIRVRYSHGYLLELSDDPPDDPPGLVAPLEIQMAVRQIVSTWLRKRGTARGVAGAKGDTENLADFPETLQATIAAYARPRRIDPAAMELRRA